MYRYSSFSSYTIEHGNKDNFTGCLIGSEDGKKLAKHGFAIGAPIGANGTISTDGKVELLLSHANPSDTVHPYDSDGSLWFRVSPEAIQLRSDNRVERLTLARDIHISKLVVEVRQDVIRLVSTERSRFGKSKKRNASTRASRSSVQSREPQKPMAIGTAATADQPLVSYVTKAGDNYALLMSPAVLEHAGLAEGSRVEIEPVDNGRLIVTRSKRHFTLAELLAGMTPEREHPLEDDAPRGEETL